VRSTKQPSPSYSPSNSAFEVAASYDTAEGEFEYEFEGD
jgi:hypothetical protein